MNAPFYLFFFVLSSSLKLIYTQKIREDQSKGRDSDVGNKKLGGQSASTTDNQSSHLTPPRPPPHLAPAPRTDDMEAPQVSHAREEREAAALAAASCRY